jgi:cell shape-determining protein MreD
MTAFIYILICLGFIVLQTTLFPLVSWLDGFYDLLIPFVVYLGLFRPLKEGLPVVFFLGLTMDTLSGGAFGIYSTTYFWLYGGIAWLIGFLHFKNNLLLPFVVVVGVFLENLVFLGTVKLGNPDGSLPLGIFRTVSVQLIWAMFTGPLLLLLIRSVHRGWTKWIAERFGDRENQDMEVI